MAAHGAQKLFGWFGGYGIAGTGGFFESLGFRPGRLLAVAAGLGEMAGGLLVASGLFGPVGPAVMLSVMIVASSLHWNNGLFAMENGIELPLLYSAGAVALALTGYGAYSLDALFGIAGLWTPELIWTTLAVGVIGGVGNVDAAPRAGADAGRVVNWFETSGQVMNMKADPIRRGLRPAFMFMTDPARRTNMSVRPIRKVLQATPTREGAGVKLQRAFGFGNTSEFDPFLLFDDFRNENPEDYLAGFPWHPHRGIETITYVLAGTVEHGDSLGNRGNLGAGDVQWMTAGSGILHQEMPRGDARGRMHGFQLWANLPSSLKMTTPRYQDVAGKDIPEVVDDDGTAVRVICGEFWGRKGPIEGVAADPRYLDVSVAARPDEASGGGNVAPRVRVRVCGFRIVPRRLGSAGRAHRGDRDRGHRARSRHQEPLAGALRPRRRGRGAGGRGGHPVPARLRQADRGAGGVVRTDRHEHEGAAAAGPQRAAKRNVHQRSLRSGSRGLDSPSAAQTSRVRHELARPTHGSAAHSRTISLFILKPRKERVASPPDPVAEVSAVPPATTRFRLILRGLFPSNSARPSGVA